MSIPICGIYRMMPMRRMHGMGFMNYMQKPDASEIANQMINNFDKDGDGALNADELGKLSDRIMPMRRMHGMGFMHCMQKPDASEIANQIINNRDKDGDGALNADELGKLSDRMGLVEADFNEDGLIDQEKLVSKISEKLEQMEGLPRMRGLKIYRTFMNNEMAEEIGNELTGVVSGNQSNSETELTGVVSGNQSNSETELTGVVSEPESNSETELTGVVSEPESNSETELTGVVSGNQSNSETELTGVVSEPESNSETELTGVVSEPESNSETELTGVVSEPESNSETELTGVVSEPESNSETELTGVVSGNQSISDLVKQLLSQLDLSNEEAESFLEAMKNYGINVAV